MTAPTTAATASRDDLVPGTWRVDIGGAMVRVRVTGRGVDGQPPLVLVAGVGSPLESWDALARHLRGRQLVSFDFPGIGGSDPSPLPPVMVLNALVLRRLLEALGLGRVDLLGYSWGGLLAQQFSLQYPGVVRRLILASSTPGLGGLPVVPSQLGLVSSRRGRSDLARMAALTEWARPGFVLQLMAAATQVTLPLLPLLRTPTLVISGDSDTLVPVANQHILASLIPRSELRILPRGGHLVLGQRPAQCGRIIEEFLGR